MTTRIYWFRTDLRVDDHPGLSHALAGATRLLPVYCHDPRPALPTPWGFAGAGPHRRHFLAATLADLDAQLRRRGSALLQLRGEPGLVLPELAAATGAGTVVCESIEQPVAVADLKALRAAGLAVQSVWLSTLLDPGRLPYPIGELPRHFTPFRQSIERAGTRPRAPVPAPDQLPPLPELPSHVQERLGAAGAEPLPSAGDDPRSSFPYRRPEFAGGQTAAWAHLARYFGGPLPLAYKTTRNQLSGAETSTKFSPWLATGALSAHRVLAALREFEARHGPGEGSYAIWFELLWRDFFRLLALRARTRGIPASDAAPGPLSAEKSAALARWCAGQTGVSLVDAGMRELAATGFLSNRLRQVVASFLIHELAVPYQCGAAWFAAQLLDFDPYSNDGNWRYIAGTGADPRGGRHFNIDKQARDHDPDGQFRVLWGTE